MSTVRLKRLTADFDKLAEYARQHPRLKIIQAEGNPPERYQLEYRIKSLRMVDGSLKQIKSHLVEIALPRNYPRTPPQCRMLSPVFHPNIAPHAICVGDHWSAGEPLPSIVSRIGEMLAFQSYNVKSPLNGEAARWVEENEERLPLDVVSMIVEEDPDAEHEAQQPKAKTDDDTAYSLMQESTPSPAIQIAAAAPEPAKPAATEERIPVTCTQCRHKMRVPEKARGKRVRCSQCRSIFRC